jgi:hypothetical protein
VHRAILGSVERFMAILIEHLAGKWPFWLSPRQIIVCPISDKSMEYCESVYLYLHRLGYNCQLDHSSGSISKKVRNAQLAQWNYILVAGEDEMKKGMVDVRLRDGNKRIGNWRIDDLVEHLKSLEPKNSQRFENFYEKAWDPANFPREGEQAQASSKAAGKPKAKASIPQIKPRNFSAYLDDLEQKLSKSQFLGGARPNQADN